MMHTHKRTTVDTDCCCGHNHERHGSHDGHNHDQINGSPISLFLPPVISLLLLLLAIAFDDIMPQTWFVGNVRLVWYLVAYAIVGLPVLKDALKSILTGDVFSEFLLMSIATIGAFAIGVYPEGVAVMLFYAVGELFQTMAVSGAKRNIKALLDQRPDVVSVLANGVYNDIKAEEAKIGDIVQLKPGEKLALDGMLLSDRASFNTAALTGESKPATKIRGDVVLAGMINLNMLTQVQITTAYEDSKLSRILELVQHASSQKAPTELFIRKFARIYTPVVVFLAIAICLVPYLFTDNYIFSDWLYRALLFLVISCPCALVMSIPLGYFGGIGAASRNGILVKGGNFLDILASVSNVVMDKTGTLTAGVFEVKEVFFDKRWDKHDMLQLVNAVESLSSHPVATAVRGYVGEVNPAIRLYDIQEIAGHGLKGRVGDKEVLVGNFKLMDQFDINYDLDPSSILETIIAVAYDGDFVGYISIADRLKEDARETIDLLRQMGIKTTLLSGDKNTVVQHVSVQLGVDEAFGDLLPEDKVDHLKALKTGKATVAFVGDGVNDAPVVAISDVGIAMGGLGSDATVETADVVIQDDRPIKIPMAIKISKQTKRIVWQNITFAFAVKGIVLLLGAGGIATMWEAVFADVGVSLLAILNAIRIQRMNF